MPRPNGVVKLDNDYQKLISRELFEKTPKSVFAALAVSMFLNDRNYGFEQVDEAIISEWKVLYEQMILPQKPAKISHR